MMRCAGRRSLLIHVPDSICGDLCITSVSCPLTHLKGFAVCPEVSNKILAARAEQDASSGAAAGEPSAFWEVGHRASFACLYSPTKFEMSSLSSHSSSRCQQILIDKQKARVRASLVSGTYC